MTDMFLCPITPAESEDELSLFRDGWRTEYRAGEEVAVWRGGGESFEFAGCLWVDLASGGTQERNHKPQEKKTHDNGKKKKETLRNRGHRSEKDL
jgi:hypothetical protein